MYIPIPQSSESPHPTASRRGSGIVVAIVFSGVIAMLVASMLGWVMTESRLNQRSLLRLEARNAAEALAEYGFCQIRYKMENKSTFDANSFTPSGANALSLPSSSLLSGTRVDTSESALVGGPILAIFSAGSSSLYYVDANDPNHTNDPLKGKWVFRRDIPVYAKAKVVVQDGPPITAYVRQKISVRGAPLFAHAAFYNMDLELAPGAEMNLYGPVHANGDIYVSSQSLSGAKVNFRNTVTCTGNIYHAWKSFQPTAQGQTNGTTGEALRMAEDVTFKNRLGAQISMDASGIWKDSTMGVSTTVKNNNASYTTQEAYTAALVAGATTNLTAFRTFASTTWHGNLQTAANGVQNYTPVAIGRYVEDPTPTDGIDQTVNTGRLLIEPPTATTSSEYSAEVEAQKYSTQAGIYVTIVPASGSVSSVTSNSTHTTTVNNPVVAGTITVRTGGPTGTVATSLPAGLLSYNSYQESVRTSKSTGSSTTTVSRGIYDQRRGSGQDLVEVDITVLKTAVDEMQKAAASRDPAKAIDSLEPSHWTGRIYFEVASNPSTTLAGATIPASGGDRVAIRLINGNIQVPSYGTVEGLTIATNAPLYIRGHFNDTGSSPSASVSKAGETPAAIAADAVTILSAGFNDSTSKSAVRPSASGDAVVAAAILTGLSPTNKNGSARMSGGAHNLVRFLENWTSPNSRTVYLRGSLVALFESRVADEPWKIDYYSAPVRNYGFCDLLQNGRYPPGTPRVISYRRTDYADMTKAEYDAAIAALP